jgi:hypothetical protein
MLEGRGVIIDFAHVLSIADPIVRSVLENEIGSRLGAARYRQFRLAPQVMVLLFDKPASRVVTDALHSLERDLDSSHCGRLEWKRYDLQTELNQFRTDCRNVMHAVRVGHEDTSFRPDSDRLGALLHVIDAMRTIDLSSYIREQSAVRLDAQNNPTTEFKEVWVNLDEIEQSIGVAIRNDPWKFSHVTEFLDFKVLDSVTRSWGGGETISINVHCANVMQGQFDDMAFRVNASSRNQIIFELSLSEYIREHDQYVAAVKKVRDAGFRAAADSAVWPVLEKMTGQFPNVQFIKVPWSDAFAHLTPDQTARVQELIQASPGIEFVLNRCGRVEDVEIGKRLGFRLFQGWGVPGAESVARVSAVA